MIYGTREKSLDDFSFRAIVDAKLAGPRKAALDGAVADSRLFSTL